MATMGEIEVTLRFTNPRCLRALRVICETLDEVAEDMPWRDDVKRAKRAANYAIHHMAMVQAGETVIVTTEKLRRNKG